MSKIFEALNRGKGEIQQTALSPLGDTPAGETPRQPPSDQNARLAAALAAEAPPIEPNAPPIPAAPLAESADASLVGVRIVSLRLSASSPVLPFDGNHGAASEQYRIIRTKLIHHAKQPRMIVIASAITGDGKTVTAVNLAGALSLKTESKVLLLDADFRHSAVHHQLGLPKEPGLADVLRGAVTLEDAMLRTEQLPNLYVLPAGEPKTNPAELLDSPRWPALCARLRQTFRYVIVDSPPVGAVADYALIQRVCDGVVLVVRPDHTNRSACLAALELIPKDRLIGAVINCVPDWFLGRTSSGYYYTDYRFKDEKA